MLPMAKNHNFWHFWGLLYRPPFTDEGQIWRARADPRSTLTDQISSEYVHCVGFRWPKKCQKPQFWANFDTFEGSCTDPLLPMRAKFGVLEQTKGLHLAAKFHLNMFIVSASGDQKPQFWAIFDNFGASCIDPLLPIRAKFAVPEQTEGLHIHAKFYLNAFIVSASNGQKPQFWTNFDIFGGSCIDPLLPIRAKFGVL